MSKRLKSSALQKQRQESAVREIFEDVHSYGLNLYLVIIFMVMPLYIYDHYYEMALHKWKIYLCATLGLLGFELIYGVIFIVFVNKKWDARKILQGIEMTDVLSVFYGISVIITLLGCGYPRAAWLGTDSWYMGTLAQLLFVATFLVFSWEKVAAKNVIWMNLITSGICFVIGIAQRYGWDIMHLYYGMPDEVIRDYLSTIGNRTWYSGYISAVFPLGIYLFWHAEDIRSRLLTGIYTVMAFSAIVTNNSDSIYLAVAAVLFGLLVMSIGDSKKMLRWMYVLVMWFVACSAMGMLRICFPEKVRVLRGLSFIFLDMRFAVLGLVAMGSIAFIFRYFRVKRKGKMLLSRKGRRYLRVGCLATGLAIPVVLLAIIVANTMGLLQEWFGFTINNNYLLFNDSWGDMRGFNWKMTWNMFCELSPQQKLFGVGSDCYAFYAYSNPVYAERLNGFFGSDTIVANSHNEWLNALLCTGIVGSLLYLGLFLSVMVKCFKQKDAEHTQPFVPAVGLCVLGYIAHNMFCYQQICATGPIFLLMGLATQNKRIGGCVENEF